MRLEDRFRRERSDKLAPTKESPLQSLLRRIGEPNRFKLNVNIALL